MEHELIEAVGSNILVVLIVLFVVVLLIRLIQTAVKWLFILVILGVLASYIIVYDVPDEPLTDQVIESITNESDRQAIERFVYNNTFTYSEAGNTFSISTRGMTLSGNIDGLIVTLKTSNKTHIMDRTKQLDKFIAEARAGNL